MKYVFSILFIVLLWPVGQLGLIRFFLKASHLVDVFMFVSVDNLGAADKRPSERKDSSIKRLQFRKKHQRSRLRYESHKWLSQSTRQIHIEKDG